MHSLKETTPYSLKETLQSCKVINKSYYDYSTQILVKSIKLNAASKEEQNLTNFVPALKRHVRNFIILIMRLQPKRLQLCHNCNHTALQ